MPVSGKQRGQFMKAARARKSIFRQRTTAVRTRTLPLRGPARIPASLISHRPELKTIDFGVKANASPQVDVVSTTPTFQLLNTIQQGTGTFNRIGNKVAMKSLHITGCFQLNNGTGAAEYNRVMVIYDRQPNRAGTFPLITDILLANCQDGAKAGATSFDMINPAFYERYTMLRDIRMMSPNNATVGGTAFEPGCNAIIDQVTNRVNVNEFIKLGDLEAHYGTTSNPITVADMTEGCIYLVTFGSSAAATAGYTFAWTSRIRYTDV